MQALHGGFQEGSLLRIVGSRPELHDKLHGIVAEHAHCGVANDFAAGDVGQIVGEEGQDSLRNPDTMDIYTVQHDVESLEPFVAFKHVLPTQQSQWEW